ncbi:MAG: alanine--tRNA ligase [Pirellulales bacterium]|nr:alanine--tRNA ligase [Pirellulales bacterium]
MKTDELREKYLAFFETKGHSRRPSDVLVPSWDPSVLFTPAGMNQFKDHFLGKVKLDFTRATTCQKCLRTGDIENVGRTAYHHTFFEMLGNFSFGDYFKREAILWAWEFLTGRKWLGIDPARLSATVYKDDDEAAEIWAREIKLPPNKIERMGEDENFWPANAPSQGPDGVCGPCSEIYYHPEHGNEVEIWNLVFTQYNRVGNPPNNLRPLPSKNIDTGMGLERTAATLQQVPTNFHIDNLYPIVLAAAEVCGVKYVLDSDPGRRLRRITDHVRTCTFAIHENVYPGPKDAKYVIRRLLRRAVLDGRQIGVHEPFLFKLVPVVVELMRGPYPELAETAERVARVIKKEEENFFGTIDAGLDRIDRIFHEMRSDDRQTVDGRVAADLYQTYGVPPELFESLAVENNLAFDWAGFRDAMKEHGDISGAGQRELFKTGPMEALKKALHSTEFVGYGTTSADAIIKGIVFGSPPDDRLSDKIEAATSDSRSQIVPNRQEDAADSSRIPPIRVVLNVTPFYGESGGQVGDSGKLVGEGFEFLVHDTQKDGDLWVHYGHLAYGVMREGAQVKATVDSDRRDGIRRAHSATHILHHALQKHVGSHAQQQGSKVDSDELRFDFTNLQAVNDAQIADITAEVKSRIAAAEPIRAEILPIAKARELGAMMLFGEKYPDPVRMVTMGDFSRELCGGTHLENTCGIGSFEIIAELAISAGTRRIIARTGKKAEEHIEEVYEAIAKASQILGVNHHDILGATEALLTRQRMLKKQLSGGGCEFTSPMAPKKAAEIPRTPEALKRHLTQAGKLLSIGPLEVPARLEAIQKDLVALEKRLADRDAAGPLTADALLEQAETIDDVTIVVAEAAASETNVMRQLIDQIRQKADPAAVMLACRQGKERVTLIAGVSEALIRRGASAGKWIEPAAKILGGGGGGRPNMAQAGGKHPEKLPEALQAAKARIKELLAKGNQPL